MYRLTIPILLLILSSCGIPKETLDKFDKTKGDTTHFPLDYCLSLPILDTALWNKNYIAYDKFLSKEILQTQAGISSFIAGVRTYTCVPSATPYVQLDSLTMINDNNRIIGDWKIICNRTISFEDSISYIDYKINRHIEKRYKDDEVGMCLSLTNKRFKLYGKTNDSKKFILKRSKKYCINNRRYIMLYNISKAGAAINFIGLDKDGRLILEGFVQQERSVKNKFQVFHATMIQFIFIKIK
jgi:hypothetical protein